MDVHGDDVSERQYRESPFPDLKLSTAWLALKSERANAIWGHENPTAKSAFLQACLAGHGEFFTTARSYIHFFPWVLASFLDSSKVMKPSDHLVRKGSGRAESTVREWGIHDIARHRLMHRYGAAAVRIPEIDPGALGPRPVISALQGAWNHLFGQVPTEPVQEIDPDREGSLVRAAQVAWINLWSGTLAGGRPIVPARPREHKEGALSLFDGIADSDLVGGLPIVSARPREHEEWAYSLFDRIAAAPPQAVQAGLKVFVERVDLDGVVRFDPETDVEQARCYIRLLCEIGFSRHSIAMTHDRQAWKERLGYQGIYLTWAPAPSTQGPVLSIWPDLKATVHGNARGMRAALRFALVMGYIRFGGHADFKSRPPNAIRRG